MNAIESLLEKHFDQSFTYDSDLFEQGMTSLSVLRLIELTSRELHVSVDIEAFLACPTPQHLYQLVQATSTLSNGHTNSPVGSVEVVALNEWLTQHAVTSNLKDTDDLFEQGVTSLGLLQLVEDLKRQQGIVIDIEALLETPILQRLKQLAGIGAQVIQGEPATLHELEQKPCADNIDQRDDRGVGANGLLLSDKEKAQFIAQHHQLRVFPTDFPRLDCPALPQQTFDSRYHRRRSRRQFLAQSLTAKQITDWLQVLNSGSGDKPKYLYPSAGGTYSVQVYIEIKPGCVKGFEGGIYYFHPVEHSLIRLTNQMLPRTAHFFYNREYYDAAQFCVYLVAAFDAIQPLYKEQSPMFSAVEAGCMVQLLTQEQTDHCIGSCVLAGVDVEQLRLLLNLGDNHRPLVSMACGYCDKSSADSIGSGNASIPTDDTSFARQTYPLSENQRGLWSLQQTHPAMVAYNCPALLVIDSAINGRALEQTCHEFTDQHPIFHTTFQAADGQVRQSIQVDCPPMFTVEQVSGQSQTDIMLRVESLIKVPFDLAKGPLLRVHLLTESTDRHWLLLITHHIVCDGNSFKTLLQSFFARYSAVVAGKALPAQPAGAEYAEFIACEQQHLKSQDGLTRLQFWQHKLSDHVLAQGMATDLPRTAVMTFAGDTQRQLINDETGQAIHAFVNRHKLTAPTLFLGVFNVLLSKYLCTQRVVVGLSTAGRDDKFRACLGYFANMVPICSELSPDMPRSVFLRDLQREVIGSISQSYPFSALVKALEIPPSTASYPVFCHAFVFQDYTQYGSTQALLDSLRPDINATLVGDIQQQGQYELMLEVVQGEQSFELNLKFNPDLFHRDTIARMLEQYQQLLNQFVFGGEFTLSEYHCLPETDTIKLNVWNQTSQDYPQAHVLHHIIEEQAKLYPEQVAVSIDGDSLSYRQLFDQSCLLGAHMQRKGVAQGNLVGVCMHRSLELVVSLLAIIRAGGAYVPIDPDLPADRVQFIVEDSEAALLLCQDICVPSLTNAMVLPVTQALLLELAQDTSLQLLDLKVTPEHPAYVIYTSGSTGKPKGCLLSHQAVCNRILWMQDAFPLTKDDRVLQKTPYSFDVSVWEFFWPLMVGAQMVLAKPGGHKLPHYLADLMFERSITVCHFVPSMLNVFVEAYNRSEKLPLRYLFTSGEALTYAQLNKTLPITTGCVCNLYGPTEAAIDVSYWLATEREDQKVPIGKPIANVQLYVLDEQLKICPIGVPGQLYIAGICLAEGYVNRQELTAERFIVHPSTQQRLYKTGDLARWLADGNIEYLGRTDHQVKVRGFRIELGEIEHQLGLHYEVANAVVNVVDVGNEKLLAAYYTKKTNTDLSPKSLREYLSNTLPDYMVPSYFVLMDEIPTNYSGKADRKKLPDPRKTQMSTAITAPSNDTEQILLALWQEMLGLERLSTTQSFFELGGHSLSAVMLLLEVNKRFPQSNVSQVKFYQQPTIVALAKQVLQGHALSGVTQRLQTLSASPCERPSVTLICCPYAGASVSVFQPMADYLSNINATINVVGVTIPGNEVGDKSQDISIVALASDAAKEIQAQVSGPIIIYGHCVGSFLALELTHQLKVLGLETVSLVVGGRFHFLKYLHPCQSQTHGGGCQTHVYIS